MILNPKYKPSKKNGYNPPECKDERLRYIPVACGNCIECRKKKQREWKVRIMEEIKNDKSGKFITLTFSEEELKKLEEIRGSKEANDIATLGMRRFLERWRKKFGTSVKHWMITELGHRNTERIHLHGIIWTNEDKETIESIWKYGRIDIGYSMGERCVNYIMKYITKPDKDHKGFIGKILTTKGIGKEYIGTYDEKKNKYVPRETNETYRLNNGERIGLPQYYRRKIYTEEEREKLWLEKIENNEIYVLGNRIKKVDVNMKELEDALEYARKLSIKRGFGGGEKKKQYLTRNGLQNMDEELIAYKAIIYGEKMKKHREKVKEYEKNK